MKIERVDGLDARVDDLARRMQRACWISTIGYRVTPSLVEFFPRSKTKSVYNVRS